MDISSRDAEMAPLVYGRAKEVTETSECCIYEVVGHTFIASDGNGKVRCTTIYYTMTL